MPLVNSVEIDFKEKVFTSTNVADVYWYFRQNYYDVKLPPKLPEPNKRGWNFRNVKGSNSDERISC